MTDPPRVPNSVHSTAAEYESALRRNKVTPLMVFGALLELRRAIDEDDAAFFAYYFDKLTASLPENTAVVNITCYEESGLGVVLTDDDEMSLTETELSSVNHLLRQLYAITLEACRNLPPGEDRTTVASDVFSTVSLLLGSVDALDEEEFIPDDTLAFFEADIERIHRYYVRAAERSAVLTYMRGMAIGLPALLLMATIVGLGMSLYDASELDGESIVTALVAGGLGAVISVMTRIGARRLEVDFEAARTQIIALGAFRPFIGAVFGVALAVLIDSGLLPLRVGASEPGQNFYAAIAFLAGFSERWAQDMLGLARKTGQR